MYDSSWTLDNKTRNLQVTSYQQRTFKFNGLIKWTKQSTGNVQTKPTVTDIQKWRGTNPMSLITTQPETQKKSYQEQTLRFNGWIKWTQKSTGNVKTKQTVTDVKKRGRNNPMGPISLFQTVLEQLTTKPGT